VLLTVSDEGPARTGLLPHVFEPVPPGRIVDNGDTHGASAWLEESSQHRRAARRSVRRQLSRRRRLFTAWFRSSAPAPAPPSAAGDLGSLRVAAGGRLGRHRGLVAPAGDQGVGGAPRRCASRASVAAGCRPTHPHRHRMPEPGRLRPAELDPRRPRACATAVIAGTGYVGDSRADAHGRDGLRRGIVKRSSGRSAEPPWLRCGGVSDYRAPSRQNGPLHRRRFLEGDVGRGDGVGPGRRRPTNRNGEEGPHVGGHPRKTLLRRRTAAPRRPRRQTASPLRFPRRTFDDKLVRQVALRPEASA